MTRCKVNRLISSRISKLLRTILYCSVSIMTLQLSASASAYLSNIDLFSSAFLASSEAVIGCNCLWSPIKIILFTFGDIPTMGINVSGSVHIPHSSMIIWPEKRKTTLLLNFCTRCTQIMVYPTNNKIYLQLNAEYKLHNTKDKSEMRKRIQSTLVSNNR